MVYHFLLLIGLTATLIASITDIKTREVPDWLNYGLLSAALGVRLIYSLITNYWPYFLYALLVSAVLFGIGFSMYYLKQWGGGDVKLIAGLGALFAFFPEEKFFIVEFMVVLLITGAFYTLVYSIFLAIKNKEKFKVGVRKLLNKYKIIRKIILVVLILTVISLFINLNKDVKFMIAVIVVSLVVYFYLYILIKAVENICMYKKVSVNQLKEEDWLGEDLKIGNKIIKKTIPGLTKKHIDLIKKSKMKFVTIKEGIPFVPSFFFATAITIIITQLF